MPHTPFRALTTPGVTVLYEFAVISLAIKMK